MRPSSKPRPSSNSPSAQLEYTDIRAPVDGIIINRKIDPGQTLAAQFQTPELFVIAPDMEKHMYVHASVDEADIGLIRDARSQGAASHVHRRCLSRRSVHRQDRGNPPEQHDDAKRRDLSGRRRRAEPRSKAAARHDRQHLVRGRSPRQLRQNSQLGSPLLPAAAARARPRTSRCSKASKTPLPAKRTCTDSGLAASERAEARRKRNRRHVWIQDGYKLRAVEVQTGISDSHFTELVSGDVKPGDKLIIGIKPAAATWGQ